jgi:hypothetical protein
MLYLILSILLACGPDFVTECTPFFAEGCASFQVCATCDDAGCETFYDLDGRIWTCDGRDRDQNGFEDCVDYAINAACGD